MTIPILFGLAVLIWGSTWYAIEFQLGVVAAEVSLTYRYAIATVLRSAGASRAASHCASGGPRTGTSC
jgi:hypothetical protein